MTHAKTMGQAYFDEVEALKAAGRTNADAIRETAVKHGKKENAVRSSLHQYKTRHVQRSLPGGPRRARRDGAVKVDDLLENARASLREAVGLVDLEVEQVAKDLESARSRYEAVLAEATAKKSDLEAKLAALSA